jgi:predicted MFS family arabinose efflux permease
MQKKHSFPSPGLVATVASIFLLQVAVTLARPVSTYRLLALGSDGITLGLTTACFAVPPIVLAVSLGRWSERRHPAILPTIGAGLGALAAFMLCAADAVPIIAAATTVLGVGHTLSAVGTQSVMAQAHSSVAHINRLGALTSFSALGQIAGSVFGGLIIGHSDAPSLASTSSALLVAAWVFVASLPVAILAMQTRIQASTVRTGRAERVWRLLRRPGMSAALMTSFSAKSGTDLLLVYMPLLGAAIGLTPLQVGVLLGLSYTGAVLARATTPLFLRRVPILTLTVLATFVASICLAVLALNHNLVPLLIAMSLLGFVLGISQTTTMGWVIDLVDDTSRGSALGLRVATNRLAQCCVLVVVGAVSAAWGIEAAFGLLGIVMCATAVTGIVSDRRATLA